MKKKLTNIKISKRLLAASCLSLLLVKDEANFVMDNYVPYFNTGNINTYNNNIKKYLKLELENGFVPQGICIVNNKILVTLYKDNYSENSCIYVIDKNKNTYDKVSLDVKAHCGGITCDEKNGNVWISANNGYINCYKLNDILNNNQVKKITSVDCSGNIENHQGNESVSYLTFHDNKMYVGNFNYFSLNTIMKIYQVDDIDLHYKCSIDMPNCIQGITFKDDKMIVSRSYGKFNSSQILIYDYNDKIDDYKRQYSKMITTPSLQQQLVVDGEELYLLFESNADIYQNELFKSEDIAIVDYKKLIK